ncbi:FtsX-like permease family protein [Flavobacteriaceae bacterium AU392]|nr:ABC transporter permease [Flavobacteriaceae bacterium]RKM81463.1 FtsX-like permease family protein [Flavobacteriaceae bacterium AU392]
MLRHNIRIALRNFKKSKSSFLINVIGLSTGLACVLLIVLWINDEKLVDAFHEKKESIYQVMSNHDVENKIITMDNSSLLLGEALAEEIPEITSFTTTNADFITPIGLFSNEEEEYLGKGIFASPNFFDTFSFDLLIGDIGNVLTKKNSVVLSEDLAIKLFNTPENAIGKTLNWDYKWSDGSKEETVEVSGVFKNISSYSTLTFDAVVSTDLLAEASRWASDWKSGYAKTYLTIKPGTDITALNTKIAKYLTTKTDGREIVTLFVQQFSERYLKAPYENGVQSGGRITYIKLFAIIAILILLIACINFMNLSTAQASRRLKEIGVKKVLGSRQKALVIQFISESFLLTLFSMIVALIIVSSVLPYFNQVTGKSIYLAFSFNFILSLLGLMVVTGVLAGSYPAFYLSSFTPISVLKGKLSQSFGDLWIRKGLVIFQFALSVIFIIGVFIVNRQMAFVMEKNIGYQRDNIVTFDIHSDTENLDTFINELKGISGIAHASFMNGSILDGTDGQSGFMWRGNPRDKGIMFQSPRVGYGFIETVGIDIIEGRTFSRKFNDDHNRIILNRAAVALMELEDPIGVRIDKSGEAMEVIGVVEDFQYGSLHKKMEPLILRFRDFGTSIVMRFEDAVSFDIINQIEEVYHTFQPGYPFEFSFLDTEYQQLYEAENRVATLSKVFTLFVVLISCLGLLGLTIFNSGQRRKEIGVRKVLGASMMTIVALLSKDFLKLVVVSILIALPVAWLVMQDWLRDFAYSIHLEWWVFAVASLIVVIIALITVSIQAIKAAMVNPLESLKVE